MNIANPGLSTALPQLSTEVGSAKATGGASGSFGSAVGDAINSLNQAQKSSEQEIARAVTGEQPDLHRTLIALQTADLSFQFSLAVRNKIIGAYEEIMRMQV